MAGVGGYLSKIGPPCHPERSEGVHTEHGPLHHPLRLIYLAVASDVSVASIRPPIAYSNPPAALAAKLKRFVGMSAFVTQVFVVGS
jgi:hypothetical protein